MKKKIEKEIITTKEKVEEIIKNSDDFKNYNLEYILRDNNNLKNSVALITEYDELAEVDLENDTIKNIADWAYNIDDEVFERLENNVEITYMSLPCHHGIWSIIADYYPDDIEHKKGMQEYLKYCKENNITRKKLEQGANYKGIDIMKLYKKKNKTLER